MNIYRMRSALILIVLLAPATALAATGAATTGGTWHRLAPAPIAPDFGIQTAVWTGKQLLVFGRDEITAVDARGARYSAGATNVAAAYDPAAGAWHKLSPPGPAAQWALHSVWTGKEMLLWAHGTRLAYDPSANTWRQLPRSSLLSVHDGYGTVAWTGRELVGWGGGCCGDRFSDGVAYDPARNRWRRLPRAPLPGSQHPLGAWTGRRLIVVSGSHAAAYVPAANSWRRLASAPAARPSGIAVWDGRELLVVGGNRVGLAYRPAANTWRRLPPTPLGRTARTAVWTGRQLLVWSGRGGAAYDPRANRWSPLPRGPLPSRLEPSAIWTGKGMIVWGGVSTKTWGEYATAGAIYEAVTR